VGEIADEADLWYKTLLEIKPYRPQGDKVFQPVIDIFCVVITANIG
jgi:hypothetical protein